MPLFILAIVAAVLLVDVVWLFICARLLKRARVPRWLRVLNGAFLALLLAAILVTLLGRRIGVEMALPAPVTSIAYLWHLLIVPVLLGALVLAAVVLLVRWPFKRRPVAPPDEAVVSRRQFLGATAALAPSILCTGLTGVALRQIQQFRVRRFDIPIADLPQPLDGLTIAHVSDIHVGRFTSGAVLRRITATTNDLRADVILLTGDLINGAATEIPEAIETVRRFDSPAGVYSVEGNHDLFAGRAEFEGRIKAAGIPLLVNEQLQLTIRGFPIQLLGLRWGAPGDTRPRPGTGDDAIAAALDPLLQLRNPDAFPILLAHHPHAFDPAAVAGLPLTLAGHTHGGQLMINEETGFGPMMFRYWSGLYSNGGRHLVVSNGVGNWFPLRTSAPAEIIHLTLRRA